MQEKKRTSGGGSVLKGAAIIGVAGIIVKILGAIFKIPLSNWMGELGMSYYQVSYNIYTALVVMSTAGFPVAISKLVSENIAKGNYGNAHKVFKVAMGIMAIVGGASCAICLMGANAYTSYIGNPLAASALKAVAPALVFVPILSGFRGFFQGRQNMNPTALSEIIEQLIRVVVGFTLTRAFLSKGLPEAAAGASFGAPVGSMFAVGFMVLVYVLHKNVIRRQIASGNDYYEDAKTIVKKILTIAIPIIIGAEIIPIMYSIDMTIIMKRLQATGWSEEESQRLYGLMGAYCNSLINLPEFLIQAIAISMVPAISHAVTKGDRKDVESSIGVGYRLTTLIAFPCMVGLIFLARPILALLYPLKVDEAMEAVPTFIILALSIVTLAMYETSTGTLQAIGKQIIPVRNVAISAIAKIVLTFVLVGIHSINVKGAAISSVAVYLLAFILNERAVKKYTGIKIDIIKTYLKPAAASGIMGAVAVLVYLGLKIIIGPRLGVCIAIIIAVIVYVLMVVLLKVATREEIEEVPYGDKINNLISRFIKW